MKDYTYSQSIFEIYGGSKKLLDIFEEVCYSRRQSMSYDLLKSFNNLDSEQQKCIILLVKYMSNDKEKLVPHKIFSVCRHSHEKQYGYPYTLSYHNSIMETYFKKIENKD